MKIKPARKVVMTILQLPLSFLALHLIWYFAVMGPDLKYLFVWRHALSAGPGYAPSIIMWLTIVSFVVLWLVILALRLVRKRRPHVAADEL